MANTIETIPVWEAAKDTEGCIFCTLYQRLEDAYLEHYMGDSKMESSTRIETNRDGFCARHFQKMLTDKEGKLGLALMTHTHMLEQMTAWEKEEKAHAPMVRKGIPLVRKYYKKLWDSAHAQAQVCPVCKKTDAHMDVYYRTYAHLLEHDETFAAQALQSKGFCMEHYAALMYYLSGHMLSPKMRSHMLALQDVQRKELKKDADDLDWFTQKFDYRNADKPWGDAKTALPRAIARLVGTTHQSSDSQ